MGNSLITLLGTGFLSFTIAGCATHSKTADLNYYKFKDLTEEQIAANIKNKKTFHTRDDDQLRLYREGKLINTFPLGKENSAIKMDPNPQLFEDAPRIFIIPQGGYQRLFLEYPYEIFPENLAYQNNLAHSISIKPSYTPA